MGPNLPAGVVRKRASAWLDDELSLFPPSRPPRALPPAPAVPASCPSAYAVIQKAEHCFFQTHLKFAVRSRLVLRSAIWFWVRRALVFVAVSPTRIIPGASATAPNEREKRRAHARIDCSVRLITTGGTARAAAAGGDARRRKDEETKGSCRNFSEVARYISRWRCANHFADRTCFPQRSFAQRTVSLQTLRNQLDRVANATVRPLDSSLEAIRPSPPASVDSAPLHCTQPSTEATRRYLDSLRKRFKFRRASRMWGEGEIDE